MKKLFITLLALFLIGFLIVHFYVPRIITQIKLPPFKHLTAPVAITGGGFMEVLPHSKKINFTSADGFQLTGYLTPALTENQNGTIIFLHGIRSGKEQFIQFSKSISEFGFNCVALDLRAHGESEGTHCTFGVKEKNDISSLLSYLKENEDISENYGVWGMSLGGAVALQCLSNEKRLKFGIIECTFSDFKQVATDYFNRNLGFSAPFLSNYIIKRACQIADFNPDEASPKVMAPKITQPVLVFHGTADKNIDISYGKENFEAISSTEKRFIALDGGTHYDMVGGNIETYFENITDFLISQSR